MRTLLNHCQGALRRLAALPLPLLLASLSAPAHAVCAAPTFTAPAQVRLDSESVLIVTHASSFYDPRFSSKYGVDAAVRYAKSKNMPVVYLIDDESPFESYFMEDCKPTYWVRSLDGEVPFKLKPLHVYLTGGHLELCLAHTAADIIERVAKKKRQNFELTYVMDGIYSNGKLIEETDPYYNDFDRFMGVVTYGRPGGPGWPKLNLLETVAIIMKTDEDLNYLAKTLPRWDRTLPADYRIELQLDDVQPKVLRAGNGNSGPKVKFHFVDSADLLSL